ncbi:Uncharacterized protein FKW44_022562, partial [Caligus rogercresseyi]
KSILPSVKASNESEETQRLQSELEAVKSKLKMEKMKNKTETALIKKSLEEERASRISLENQLKDAQTRHREYESELGDLKTGLEALKTQLETRDESARSLLNKDIDELEASLQAHRLKSSETLDKHERLKSKSKELLKRLKKERILSKAKDRRILVMKSAFERLKSLSKAMEADYRYILLHLGGQIDLIARLLSAYFDGSEKRHWKSSNEEDFIEWFARIQASALWAQKQVVSNGIRNWKGQDGDVFKESTRISIQAEQDDEETEVPKSVVFDAVKQVSTEYPDKLCNLFAQIENNEVVGSQF